MTNVEAALTFSQVELTEVSAYQRFERQKKISRIMIGRAYQSQLTPRDVIFTIMDRSESEGMSIDYLDAVALSEQAAGTYWQSTLERENRRPHWLKGRI